MKKNSWPRIRKRIRSVNGVTKIDYCIDSGICDGKRRQEFAQTLEAAETRAEEIRNEYDRVGSQAFALSAEQRLAAARAFQRLAGIASLDAVVDYYIASKGQALAMITVGALQDELLAYQAKRQLRPRTIQATRVNYASFVRQYADIPISDITLDQIESWLDTQRGGSKVTLNNGIRYLTAFFSFAIRRGYITASPMTRVERPRIKLGAREFLSIEDIQKLLAKAEEMDPKMIPKLVIGLFAGVRPAELHRLRWENISFENRLISINADASKCGIARYCTIEKCLLEWLFKYQQQKGSLGLNAKRFGIHRQKLCEAAGIADWPANAMRHSFATYHLAMFENAAKTAFELGHTQGVQLLYRHYRGLTTRAEAERFWQIKPSAVVAVAEKLA